MYLNHDFGGARRVASQPIAKITIDEESMLLEKLRKSDRRLGDYCLCLQHMFMAAAGEWRDEVSCSKFTSISLERAVHSLRSYIY